MSHVLTPATAIGGLALLLTACTAPRKAQERACHKAARTMARAEVRAAHLCPSALVRDSVALVPGTAAQPLQWATVVDTDSLLAACASYAAAISLQRDSLIHLHYAASTTPTTRPAIPRQTEQVALVKLRRTACEWEPFHYENEYVHVAIRNVDGRPLATITTKATKLPCPPAVKPTACPPAHGVASWYRTFFWCIIGVLVIAVAGTLSMLITHHAGPRG